MRIIYIYIYIHIYIYKAIYWLWARIVDAAPSFDEIQFFSVSCQSKNPIFVLNLENQWFLCIEANKRFLCNPNAMPLNIWIYITLLSLVLKCQERKSFSPLSSNLEWYHRDIEVKVYNKAKMPTDKSFLWHFEDRVHENT